MKKYCKNCECDSERYADGRCKACTLRRHALWAAKNRDVVNRVSRAWNASNGAQKRALNAVYRSKNAAVINEKRRAQRAADPSIERVKTAKRRALKKQNGGVLSKDIVQRLLITQKGLCACCGTPLNGKFHLDHIMPLALGGANADFNVQLLTPSCNMRKHKLHPDVFLARKHLQDV